MIKLLLEKKAGIDKYHAEKKIGESPSGKHQAINDAQFKLIKVRSLFKKIYF